MRDKAIISSWWRGVNEQPVNLLKDILEDTRCVVEGGALEGSALFSNL